MFHIFFAGVLELSLETYCCQDVLLAVFIVLRALARICLAWIRFSFVGCLLNFRKADFLLFIEFLTSLYYQGLFLFEYVEDFGWMDGYFVYGRSTLKGHIASNKLYVI